MGDKGKRGKGRRLTRSLAVATLLAGAAVSGGPAAHGVEGLCNGQAASHSWLNASGQHGPALIDGTGKDDVIIGSDGDDTINGKGGDDVICGELGNDSISGGARQATRPGGGGGDNPDGGPGDSKPRARRGARPHRRGAGPDAAPRRR